MKFRKLILFFLLSQATGVFAAPIKMEVDRKTVNWNESFQITFSTTEDPDENPDFSPLEKNFRIIDRNHGSTSSWINGASNTTIQWTFEVMAIKPGKVEIPAIRFGKEISPSETVMVTDDNKPSDEVDNNAELFLQVDATPKKSYVQSQILYTVRIYTRLKIAEGKLAEPEITDAVVTKLGEDKNYKTKLKGLEYIVVERNYAIFPQKSGALTIPALTLTAAILGDDQSGFGGFFGAQATRREQVSSKAITLEILPAPASFKSHWIAAQQLQLTQQWSGDVQNMKVGEPLTRTLTLTAKGTTVGQLPTLQQTLSSDELKTYPDQPRLEERKTPQGIEAVREEKIAFIPSKAGTYTLPAVEIPWFNVTTQQVETSIIPAMTVTATGVGVAKPVDKTVENSVDKQAVINNPTVINSGSTVKNDYLWQGLAAFFALGWLLTVIFFLKRKPPVAKNTAALMSNLEKTTDKNHVAMLKKACASHDAIAAKQALIAWGQEKYDAATLGTLAELCDARLRVEILNLNQNLYGQQAQTWDGKKLFQAFSEHRAMEKAKPKQHDDMLEPLHRI